MIVALPPVLDAVQGHFDPCLVPAPARQAIAHVTALLPPGMSFFGIECRLADGTDAVDFGTGLAATDGSREIVAHRRNAAPRWQALQRLCVAWAEHPLLARLVPAVFTEFDLHGHAAEPGEPSLFGRLDWLRVTNWRDELAAAHAAARVFVDVCTAGAIDAGALDAVAACVHALPPNGWLHGIAVMLGRPARNPRLGVWVPGWRLREYIDRLGLGVFAAEIEACVRDFPDARGPFVELALDVGGEPPPRAPLDRPPPAAPVSARVGIEFTMGREATLNDEPLLDRLVARGLCCTEKAAALRAWPGSELVRLPGVDWPCTIVRQVSHLKLVIEPGPAVHAKAYLTVTPAFRFV